MLILVGGEIEGCALVVFEVLVHGIYPGNGQLSTIGKCRGGYLLGYSIRSA